MILWSVAHCPEKVKEDCSPMKLTTGRAREGGDKNTMSFNREKMFIEQSGQKRKKSEDLKGDVLKMSGADHDHVKLQGDQKWKVWNAGSERAGGPILLSLRTWTDLPDLVSLKAEKRSEGPNVLKMMSRSSAGRKPVQQRVEEGDPNPKNLKPETPSMSALKVTKNRGEMMREDPVTMKFTPQKERSIGGEGSSPVN